MIDRHFQDNSIRFNYAEVLPLQPTTTQGPQAQVAWFVLNGTAEVCTPKVMSWAFLMGWCLHPDSSPSSVLSISGSVFCTSVLHQITSTLRILKVYNLEDHYILRSLLLCWIRLALSGPFYYCVRNLELFSCWDKKISQNHVTVLEVRLRIRNPIPWV
jgi:hypothetical protein